MIAASRRSFLKLGLVSSATLAGLAGLYRLTRDEALAPYQLDHHAQQALHAIARALLTGALPSDEPAAAPNTGDNALTALEQRVQQTIHGLPLPAQQEIADLFALLSFAPTRRLLAGIADWSNADNEQVTAFLQSWRGHRLALLQSAYQALHDIIFGAWYADEGTWRTIGYPGPRTLS